MENEIKYILMEMGAYINSVTKPRIQKVIYSDNWKNGKPVNNNGSLKHIFKYQVLEQYEDVLDNLQEQQIFGKIIGNHVEFRSREKIDFKSPNPSSSFCCCSADIARPRCRRLTRQRK